MQYNAEWRVLVESCCQQIKTQEVNILEMLDGFFNVVATLYLFFFLIYCMFGEIMQVNDEQYLKYFFSFEIRF